MSAKGSLAGKVALITGGSRGIGRATALEMARRGACVVIGYNHSGEAAAEVIEVIRASGGDALSIQADVGDPAGARRLAETTIHRLGRIDVLVNNAGMQRSVLLHRMSDEDWHRVMAVNLHAIFYLCRAVLPYMYERRSGHVINVASASGFIGQAGAAGYVASKHAVIGLTKSMALEAARHQVLVNAVAPGLTDTQMIRDLTESQRERLLKMVPLGRSATPAEIAEMITFVAAAVSYSTGNVFHASGGVAMG